ncbi:MAG TPA: tail fiber domain-containing protein [Chitinophagales bacterium]|nr:tail fiber domain-containing protein [Chitinophagales bacterium]
MNKYFLIVSSNVKFLVFLTFFISTGHYANAQIKVISNGNVGIGASNPAERLHVNGFMLMGPKSGGTYSDGIKFTRSSNYPTDPAEWGIDTDKGFNIWKPHPSVNNGNFKIFIKDTTGYVGINTGTPSYRLDVNGGLRCYSFTNSSDERLKSNIADIQNSLGIVLQLNPKIYDLTVPANDQSSSSKFISEGVGYPTQKPEVLKDQTGFLAQEINEVLPHLVSKDDQGYLSLNYIGLIPYLVDAIKEQNKQIETLQEQIQGCCSVNLNDEMGAMSRVYNTEEFIESESYASLEQNAPNPFHQQTTIAYTIPESCLNSSLHIYNLNGAELRSYPISQKGRGRITVDAGSLKAGMYLYTLICDGKEVATKKMILTN